MDLPSKEQEVGECVMVEEIEDEWKMVDDNRFVYI